MTTLRAVFKARLLQGVLQGSRFWVMVGLLVGTRKLSRRIARRPPEVVFCDKLDKGQAVLITHVEPSGRHGRGRQPR